MSSQKRPIALVNLRYKINISFERKESLGLAYLSAILKQHNYAVDIIDGQFFNLSADEIYKKLMRRPYALIGVSLYQETVGEFERLYKQLVLNSINAHLCLGGQFSTFTAEALLKEFRKVDSIVFGEGELSLLELVQCVAHTKSWKEVSGIGYLKNNQLVKTKERRLIADLNHIPFPDRSEYYKNFSKTDYLTAIISASRGCYAHCAFCSIAAFYKQLRGKSIRVRAPSSVVNEIEIIYNKYGIKKFFFADDNFLSVRLIHSSWLIDFIEELKNREIKISFDIDCRVNDVDFNQFKYLKKNGLNGVFLGVESFNQRTLDTLNKNVTVQDNFDAIATLRKLRINVWMGFIMFDMFTTLAEIEQNIAAFDKINYFKYFNYDRPISSNWVSSILKLYNGTPILAYMIEKYPSLLIKKKFHYDFMFSHKETKQFYLALCKWKPIMQRAVKLDTLELIRVFNQKKNKESVNALHHLSRKYMMLDRSTFLAILHSIKNNFFPKINSIISEGEKEFHKIYLKIKKIRTSL